MDIESLKFDIKKLVLSVANISHMQPEDIHDDTSLFGEGLCLDSIDLLEMVIVLEKQYSLKLKNDDWGRKVLRNVSGIAEAIQQNNGTLPVGAT